MKRLRSGNIRLSTRRKSDVPGSLGMATPLGDPRNSSAAQPVVLGGAVDMTTVHDEAQVPSGGMK